MSSSFIPATAVIRNIFKETGSISTFRLEIIDKTVPFSFIPGQFCMLSVPHCGEAAISISSSPDQLPLFDLSIRKAGTLTGTIHKMRIGDQVGIRGPFGTPFPISTFTDNDLLIIAGGIGLAPLKSVIDHVVFHSGIGDDAPASINLLYGCRTPAEICFKNYINNWRNQGIKCEITVDEGDADWHGHVGLVTALMQNLTISNTTRALVCGPPVMISFVIKELRAKGCAPGSIITTLERHMKCGMGICGHCYIDDKMVCTDGPVFTMEQLQNMEVMELNR